MSTTASRRWHKEERSPPMTSARGQATGYRGRRSRHRREDHGLSSNSTMPLEIPIPRTVSGARSISSIRPATTNWGCPTRWDGETSSIFGADSRSSQRRSGRCRAATTPGGWPARPTRYIRPAAHSWPDRRRERPDGTWVRKPMRRPSTPIRRSCRLPVAMPACFRASFSKNTTPGESYNLSYLMVTYVFIGDRPAAPPRGGQR